MNFTKCMNPLKLYVKFYVAVGHFLEITELIHISKQYVPLQGGSDLCIKYFQSCYSNRFKYNIVLIIGILKKA